MNEIMKSFDSVIPMISSCNDFTTARKIARKAFIRQFQSLSEEKKKFFPSTLFNWANNKLHNRKINDRIAALTGLSFYVNLVDSEKNLDGLVNDFEKILPSENVSIVNGIAYILERIYRKVSPTRLPALFDRCINWVSTPHAVLSSAIFLKRLYFFTPANSQSSNKYLLQVMNSAFKFDNEQVQQIAVDLYLMSLTRDPSVDESTRIFINECIVVFGLKENQESVRAQAHGCLMLLTALMEKQRRVTIQRFDDFFPPFLHYLKNSNDDSLIKFVAYFCEQNTEGCKKYSNEIYNIISEKRIDYSKNETCESFCRLIHVFPDNFSKFGFEIAVSLYNTSQNRFFQLIESILQVKHTLVDDKMVYDAFIEANNINEHLLSGMDVFIKYFPHYLFRVIAKLHPKLLSAFSNKKNTENVLNGLKGIRTFLKYPQFSVANYWEICKDLMDSEDENVRISAIITLYSINSIEKSPDVDIVIRILFLGQNDQSKRVRYTICKEFPDGMLSVFSNISIVSLIEQFIDDNSGMVSEQAIHLLGRIKEVYPLNVINIFWQRLVKINVDFFHTEIVREKKRIIRKLPFLVQEAKNFAIPLYKDLIQFIKKLLLTKPPQNSTLNERINQHRDEKCDRIIRLSCMRTIRVIGRDLVNVIDDIPSLTRIILAQLQDNLHPNFQIEVANTLKAIFKWVDVFHETDLNILNFQMDIMKFVKSIDNPDVIDAFISLFGTIGPLDPYRFNNSKDIKGSFNSSLICDPSKREKCYLDYVMGYIIDQLNSKSRNHDPTTLINAIVYIFQSDSNKCFQYLEKIIQIFVNLFNVPDAPYASLFAFLRQIMLLVDIMILPYADSIMNIIEPFIPNGKSIDAIKTLNVLIFSMKSEFKKFSPNIFKTVVNILNSKDHLQPEIMVSLLLTLTLLTIYADGCSIEFFNRIKAATERNDSVMKYAFTFLAQAFAAGCMKELILKSLNLAMKFIKSGKTPPFVCDLLYVLIAKYPDIVLILPVKLTGINQDIDDLIATIKGGEKVDITKCPIAKKLQPTPDPYGMRPKANIACKSISSIFQHDTLLLSGIEKNWPTWAQNFAHELALCSTSPAIRACIPLINSSTTLYLNIWPLVFLSVWEKSNEKDREVLSSYIKGVVSMKAPNNILQLIAATCEQLDRANFTLFPDDPLLAGQICERCNSWFRALKFYGSNNQTSDKSTITHLLRIETQLKRKECALGLQTFVPQKERSCELLESLNMWSDARDIYAQKFAENERDESNLVGMLKCSVPLDDWKMITDRFSSFATYSRELQNQLGTIFGAAAFSTGSDESRFLDAVLEDTPELCYWRALSAISHKKFEEAQVWIRRGRSYLVRNDEAFSSGNYEPAIPMITYSMILEEFEDIIYSYTSNDPKNIATIINLWNRKLDYLRRDVTWLKMIYRERILLNTSKEEKFNMKLEFFDNLRRQNEWVLFDKLIDKKLPSEDPRVRVLREKVNFDRGIIDNLDGLLSIINELKQHYSTDVYCQAICSFASRTTDLPKANALLKEVIELQPTKIKAWKYYAYTNLRLSEEPTEDKNVYANNALNGFINLINLKQMSMHYLCQLCSIFFNYGTNLKDFQIAADKLITLPPKCVLKIMPQLFTQLSHPNKEVRDIVFRIIENLSENNYQALAFSLKLIRQLDSTNEITSLVDKIEAKNVQVSSDVKIFADSLIYLAVLPVDRFIALLRQFAHEDKQVKIEFRQNESDYDDNLYERTKEILEELVKISNENLPGFNKPVILTRNRSLWEKIEKILNGDKTHMSRVSSAIKNVIANVKSCMEKSIDIDEMNVEMSYKKKYCIAVPGTSCIGDSITTIDHVNHLMKTIPSAQRPRKMSLIGSDGHIYKYVLKGGEDLRLDQHVMQLFSLINSILKEDKFSYDIHCTIMQYGITPLSANSGLISWAEGGKTLYSMISWYRKLRGIPTNQENCIFANFKKLHPQDTPENRRILFDELCASSQPDQLKQVVWLRSPSAESWLNQTTNFARSTSLMSFVGYIIGLGDRHPSNILVMKNQGCVVHIDLSDCFEKAAMRRLERETVPFRLTRMIVQCLGPSSVYGIFEFTSECVMNALKRNQKTILAFLDIFSKESVIDVAWYEDETTKKYSGKERKNALFKKAMQRISDKLNFREFSESEQTTTANHVAKLISIATDANNLSQMYFGWSAFW